MSTETVYLGDVCDFIRGVTFDKASAHDRPTAGTLPILRAGNIQDELNADDDLIWVPGSFISEEQHLKANDIVICMSSGSSDVVGKTARVPSDLNVSVGSFCGIIRPRHKQYAGFLSFFFQSSTFKTYRDTIARGANIQNLRFSQLEEIPVRIPSEYPHITSALDIAARLRRIRRFALHMCDDLLPAIFIEMFGDPVENPQGWATDALATVSTKITDGEHLNPKFTSTGVPIVMAEQVEDSGVGLNSCKLVSSSDFSRFITKCEPKQNDILLVSRGATIGRTCVVNTDKPFCLMGSVILIKPNSDVVDPYFLAAQLKSRSFLNVLRATSGSSAQQAIYIAHVRQKIVLIPPLSLQHKFASVAQRHKRLRAVHVEALRQADHLFETLLHQAFSISQ